MTGIWSLLWETAIFDLLHGTISSPLRRQQTWGEAALLRLLPNLVNICHQTTWMMFHDVMKVHRLNPDIIFRAITFPAKKDRSSAPSMWRSSVDWSFCKDKWVYLTKWNVGHCGNVAHTPSGPVKKPTTIMVDNLKLKNASSIFTHASVSIHKLSIRGSPGSSWDGWSGPSWGSYGWSCSLVPWSCPPGLRRTGSPLSAHTAPQCHGPPGHPWCFERDAQFLKQHKKETLMHTTNK